MKSIASSFHTHERFVFIPENATALADGSASFPLKVAEWMTFIRNGALSAHDAWGDCRLTDKFAEKGSYAKDRRKWRFYVSVMPIQAGYDRLDKYCSGKHTHFMTVIDDYLTTVEPSKRKELERIRALAKQTVPGAEEAIVYGMPTLKYQGKPFLGFDAHTQHIGIYPYSGQVIETLKDQLHDYRFSKGAIRVPLDHPLSEELLKQIIHFRLLQITPS